MSASGQERLAGDQGFLYPPEAQTFLEQVELGYTDGISCWRSDAVERRQGSHVAGQGLFALTDIPASMLVAIKQGRVVNGQTIHNFARIIQGSHQQIGPDKFLTGLTPTEVDKGLVGYNHSCEPNARIVLFKGASLAFLVTRQAIKAGDEITADYAVSENSKDAHYIDPCQCSADNCRTVVNPAQDWLNEELQQRYAGEFAWYIQEAIDALEEPT